MAVIALRPLRLRRAGGPGKSATGTFWAALRGATRRRATGSTSILMRLRWLIALDGATDPFEGLRLNLAAMKPELLFQVAGSLFLPPFWGLSPT